MPSFTTEQIREISEQLDSGFLAFYHKVSGELIFLPDTDRYMDMETDAWQEDIEKLKKKRSQYQQVEAMHTKDSFNVMVDFAEQVSDANLKSELLDALDRKKPFRHFKYVIDNSPGFRQSWFDFKNNSYIEWTKDQLKIHEELEVIKKAND